ncbi:MAG: autotransporter-associated beta strand repeat-containing protein, partial [Akkermansiaceae bacterium]|nr:autotransporter-associated beta strand repeat-containing protein [Akkermansiaceae bacterium]
MKLHANRFLSRSLAASMALSSSAWAVDVIKDNNTTALNLGTSWLNDGLLGDITPATSPGHIAVWNSTVTGANSSALGASLSWEGIKITDPGGAITVTHSSAQTLTLGASGIDMSAATQNLNLLSSDAAVNLAIGANQTWNIASSRTLTLFETDNAKNERLTGSGNIEVTGGGIVRMLVGDAGSTSFTAGNGNDTYTGNWTITNGSVRSLRNGTHAWGQGTINLNGGTIGQEQGSWTWSNAINLNSSTTSTIDDFNTSGGTRSLKLQGVISGSGNINFNDSSNRMGSDTGYILTGTNTMSGTITLGANADVRVGGVTGNDTTAGAGTGGTLGTAGVNLSATTSTLTFSRSDTHTVSNVISGSGAVRIGGGVSGTSSQVITLSGANTYTGPTTLSNGTLKTTHLTALGTGTVNVNGGTLDLDANLTIGSLAGSASTVDSGNFTLTLNAASNSGTFYTGTFASTGSLVMRGGSHTVQDNSTGATGGGAGNFFILQTAGSGTAFHLDTGSSATSRRDFGWTNDTGSVLTLNSLQGHGALRGDAGSPTGGVRNILVNQATDTTFDGSILSHTSGAGVLRSLTLTKQGSGTLTLAGFIGEQTATAGVGADVVNLTVEGGLLDVTNSANGTASNGTAGTMTVSGGTLAFSNNALGKGGAGSVVMNGGTLRWNSGNTQDLTVSSRLTLVSGKTATLDTNGNNVVLSNALGGGAINASLTKTGSGSLTLEGSNAYTGNTLVSNGTLVINGSVSTGTVSVASGATLMGSGTIGGATTIDAGATLSPGQSPGLLTIDDALTLNGTTLMELGGQTLGSGYDSIAVSGLLTYGGILNIVSYN